MGGMIEPQNSFLGSLQFFIILNDQFEGHVIVSATTAEIDRHIHFRDIQDYFHLILFLFKVGKRKYRSRNDADDVEGAQIPDRNIFPDYAWQGSFISCSMEFR
jgi:hypothetical protein